VEGVARGDGQPGAGRAACLMIAPGSLSDRARQLGLAPYHRDSGGNLRGYAHAPRLLAQWPGPADGTSRRRGMLAEPARPARKEHHPPVLHKDREPRHLYATACTPTYFGARYECTASQQLKRVVPGGHLGLAANTARIDPKERTEPGPASSPSMLLLELKVRPATALAERLQCLARVFSR
jgi:hypothetical protein